jgi:hypothetical protein
MIINNNYWQRAQLLTLIACVLVVILMLNDSFQFISTFPVGIGQKIYWDIIIFSAPMIFLIIPGAWRNICPVGVLSLLPANLKVNSDHKSYHQSSKLLLCGFILLVILIPLRHVYYTSIVEVSVLITTGLIALLSGFIYKSKSGWCNGLCPLIHVEKLYGIKPLKSFNSIYCKPCTHCVSPCLDLIKNDPLSNLKKKSILNRVLFGGFPGLIWGWFQVEDHSGLIDYKSILQSYQVPLTSMIATFVLFELFRIILKNKTNFSLELFFSFSAISLYYWYRLPQVVGAIYPYSMEVQILRLIILGFFVWWYFIRANKQIAWLSLGRKID